MIVALSRAGRFLLPSPRLVDSKRNQRGLGTGKGQRGANTIDIGIVLPENPPSRPKYGPSARGLNEEGRVD